MINLNFTEDDLINSFKEKLNEKQKKLFECENECIEKLKSGIDVDDNIKTLQWIYYSNEKLYKINEIEKIENIKKDYNLFVKMARDLEREIDAKITNDEITFKSPFASLNYGIKLLAKYYGLKPGTFSFDASFTTHEAYTETGHLIHIGIDANDNNNIIIKFNLLSK